ncbi:hypothetical protein Csa_018336 [Cucumis sativus]|nr:hypothetical protein Csa_018336 [Cucumis sativus]
MVDESGTKPLVGIWKVVAVWNGCERHDDTKREAEDLCKLSNADFRAVQLAEDDGQCDEVARVVADLDSREALTNHDEQLGVWVTAAPEKRRRRERGDV